MFTIKQTYMPHKAGTKDYCVWLVTMLDDPKDRSLLIKRWGKVRTKGQTKIDGGPVAKNEREYRRIITQKRGRGYDPEPESIETLESVDELIEWAARHDLSASDLGVFTKDTEAAMNAAAAKERREKAAAQALVNMEENATWGSW